MSIDQQPTQTDHDPNSRGSGRGERLAVVVGVVVTVLAVAGIGVIVAGGDEQPAVLPAVAPSIAPSVAPPSAVPVVQTPEDLLIAEAKAAYVNFVRVGDEIAQGGFDDPARYGEVAITPERDQLIKEARQFADRRTTGFRSVVSMTPQDVVLGDGLVRPKVKLLICKDVSATDGLDATGKSIVPADRQTRFVEEVLLERFEPGTKGAERGGFYVAEVKQLLERTTC
jgi:hypothetical protein